MARKKIALIGAGNIGGTLAHLAATKELGDIVLFDVVEGVPQGKALDLSQCGPIEGFDAKLKGTQRLCRHRGRRRHHRHRRRRPQAGHEPRRSARHQPQGDEGGRRGHQGQRARRLRDLHHQPARRDGLGAARIFGPAAPYGGRHGGRARLRPLPPLSSPRNSASRSQDVTAFVLGGHGDTMVPVVEYSTVAGIPIPDLIKMGWSTQEKIDAIVKRTRGGGGEIVALLRTGSAYYAPATSGIAMAEAYLKDKKRLLPCAAHLTGQYGVDDLYVGVPVRDRRRRRRADRRDRAERRGQGQFPGLGRCGEGTAGGLQGRSMRAR